MVSVETNMKVSQVYREQAKVENDSAFDCLRADMERHSAEQSARITKQNTKMAEYSKDMVKFIATMPVGIVAVLGAFIAFLQFFG